MKTDYPELEGKTISYKYPDKDIIVPAKVIGCSYHIGITIVHKDDPKDKLVCLNRKTHIRGVLGIPYRNAFHGLIKQIRAGLIDPQIIFDTYQKVILDIPMASCAFE